MAVTFDEVEPAEVREAVVAALWEQRHWPWDTREEYYAAWDWRYTSLSDGHTRVWVAREGEEVRGHIALHERQYRLGDRDLVVAVPANFWVNRDQRGGLIGPRLATVVRDAVRRGRVDMVLAFVNKAAYDMFIRLGFRDLGTMKAYTDVMRSGPSLARWNSVVGIAAPVVDAALAVRRAMPGRRKLRDGANGLSVIELDPDDVRSMERGHWEIPTDRLVAMESPEYVARRYLECPFAERRAYGLVDATDRLEGYVVLEGETRPKVWDCQVNYGRLEPVVALDRVARALDTANLIQAPVLPGSEVAGQLRAAGYLERKGDGVVQRTRVCALWSADHPAASALSDTSRWHLWFGANHY